MEEAAAEAGEGNKQLLVLHKTIHKAFLTVDAVLQRFQKISLEVVDLLTEVCELDNALTACDSLRPDQIPFAKEFPCVLERTSHLVTEAMSVQLKNINSKMHQLQEGWEMVWRQWCRVESTLRHKCRALSAPMLAEGSCTIPATSSMLQWLQNSERILREQYTYKTQLLQRLADRTAPCDADFVKDWCRYDLDDAQTISDWLALMQFFLEEKV